MGIRIASGSLDNPNAPTDIFQQGAARGVFLLPVCTECQRYHWYPRSHCPFCHAEGTIAWEEVSGEGTIYSYSVMRKAEPLYVIAYVELAEGPIILTNVIECTPERVKVGMRVRVKYETGKDGLPLPYFTPCEGSTSLPTLASLSRRLGTPKPLL